jgi:hypothetical protein
MREWLVDHDPVAWQDPPAQTTGADGRFACTFEPPPPFGFTLRLRGEGRVVMETEWDAIAPGATLDLGDVVLLAGCRVTGEVVDQDQAPVDEVTVTFDQLNRGQDLTRPGHRRIAEARTDAAGRFALRDAVAPGTWNLKLAAPGAFSLGTVEVPALPRHHVRLTLARQPQELRPRIAGVVVDQDDRPVVKASVHATNGSPSSTDGSGAFTVERTAGADEYARLDLSCPGHAFTERQPAVRWGKLDVRLVMHRGARIEVQVVEAASRRPVEDYTVYAIPRPGVSRRLHGEEFQERASGEHPGGIATFGPLSPGPHVVVVQPRGNAWTDAAVVCEVTKEPAQRFTVAVSAAARRKLLVRDGSGAAVAGTKVELLAPLLDQPVDAETWAMRLPRGSIANTQNAALHVQDGVTAANGEAELVGPADAPLALRLLGPGHVPVVVQPVRLSDPQPLVVTVARGATFAGRVLPPRLVAQLREEGGPRPSARPGLQLFREVAGRRETYPATSDRFALDDGGGFRIEGIAPGTWHVSLCSNVPSTLGLGGWTATKLTVATLAELRDGELREQDLDLGALERGTLRGMVQLNGRPSVGQQVTLEADLGPGADRQPSKSTRMIVTDAAGRFAVNLPEGGYRAKVILTGDALTIIRSATTAFVPRGGEVDAVFDLAGVPLQLELVRADGTPAAGVKVRLSAGDEPVLTLSPTDPTGRTRAALAPLGTFTASIVSWVPPIPLGDVTVAGTDASLRLVVPAGAGF